MTWEGQLESATEAWRRFCRTLESTGTQALAKTLTHDEVDLAEGLRHLARMAQLVTLGSLENKDSCPPVPVAGAGPAPQNGRRQSSGPLPVGADQRERHFSAPRYPRFGSLGVHHPGTKRPHRTVTRFSCLTCKGAGRLVRGADLPHTSTGQLAAERTQHDGRPGTAVLRDAGRRRADGPDAGKPHIRR